MAPKPFGGFMPMVSNNSNALLNAGIGLLSGRTANEQAAMGLQGFAQGRQENKTAQWIAQNAPPELAQAVQAGVMSPADAYKMVLESRTKKAPLEINGKLVDPETYQVLADFSNKPEGPKPTSLMIELQSAGIQPGTPEWSQAIFNANKPKGMSIESDGQGGFRMVQGAGVEGLPPLNVEQGKNTGFLLRAQDAHKVITSTEEEGTSAYNKMARNLPAGAGNYIVGADAQKFDQAKRDFINAVLRQESGAVISPEEFANAEQQYFPQPGDSPQVIEQKRQNRENAIRGFEIRSGPGAAAAQQPSGVIDYRDFFGGQ
jgi:hypothetical protein